MRTTIPLEPEVHALLQEAARRRSQAFKRVLNDAVLAGLSSQRGLPQAPSQWTVFDMGQHLVDLSQASALADELDDCAR